MCSAYESESRHACAHVCVCVHTCCPLFYHIYRETIDGANERLLACEKLVREVTVEDDLHKKARGERERDRVREKERE